MRVEISFNICRICLQNTDEGMTSIYEEIADQENETIVQRIERCGGIQILGNPELPNKICRKCYAFLTVAHKFRTICKNSDHYLREFVSKNSEASAQLMDDDDLDGMTEYLHEYNPDMVCPDSTAEQVAQEIEHIGVDSPTTIDYDNMDQYTEMWLNGNDDDQSTNVDEVSTTQKEENKISIPLRRSNRTRKTLGISSDGAAIIRVKSQCILKPEKQIHICDVCGNSYERRYALEAHMRRHRNEKRFECEICQKRFHLNFQLTRHIRKHTGARPYACQYCTRNFADRSTMIKHERIHRNERPYTCTTCDKSFTYSNVLKVHMLTHTGEKPFTCGICGKRFARAHHLRAHLETQQHQNDPRSQVLLKHIKREEDIAFACEQA